MNGRGQFVTLLLICMTTSVFGTRLTLAADAKESKADSIITVDGMHCEMCAKTVTKKLQGVKNIASVRVDVKAGKVTVAPATRATVSAKSLWEAIEAGNFTPTKLEGPNGTFTKKPKS
jgi:copper chaperone CopZ